MKGIIIVISLTLIFALSACVQAAEEITLTDVADTYVTNVQMFGDARGINSGAAELLLVGVAELGDYITYIQFSDLDEYIGKGDVISADLILCRMPGNHSQTYECKISRVAGDWQENKVTWNNRPRVNRDITSTFRLPPDCDEFTADVTEIVKSWINGDYPHKGFALYNAELLVLALDFASSESSVSEEFKELFKELGMSPPKLILKIDNE